MKKDTRVVDGKYMSSGFFFDIFLRLQFASSFFDTSSHSHTKKPKKRKRISFLENFPFSLSHFLKRTFPIERKEKLLKGTLHRCKVINPDSGLEADEEKISFARCDDTSLRLLRTSAAVLVRVLLTGVTSPAVVL